MLGQLFVHIDIPVRMPNRHLLTAVPAVVVLVLEPAERKGQDRGDNADEAEQAGYQAVHQEEIC